LAQAHDNEAPSFASGAIPFPDDHHLVTDEPVTEDDTEDARWIQTDTTKMDWRRDIRFCRGGYG